MHYADIGGAGLGLCYFSPHWVSNIRTSKALLLDLAIALPAVQYAIYIYTLSSIM